MNSIRNIIIEGYDFCGEPHPDASIDNTGFFTFDPGVVDLYEFTIRAYGYCPNPALYTFQVIIDDNHICGDPNCDDLVNVSDAVYIISFVFSGGNAPNPYLSGDVNCDVLVNVSDAVWIISYVFNNGNDPCDYDGDGSPDCH